MTRHDEIEELIPAYVLGALDPDEAARIQAHLAACTSCARVLDEYRAVADQLVYAAPLVEPPRDLKTRTMQRVSGRGARERSLALPPARPWWQRFSPAPIMAATALVIALIVLGWNIWQSVQLNNQLATQRDFMTVIAYAQGTAITVHGTASAPQAEGKLYSDPDSEVAALVTVNMPVLRADQVYQVWLTGIDGQTISGGTFNIDREGNGLLLVRAPQQLEKYVHVGVSVEPRGGSAARTGQVVLETTLTSP